MIDYTNVSTAYLAECLGMTRDGVTRLNRSGVIRQNGMARGKYNLVHAVSAYVIYLRESKGDEANVRLILERERKLRLQNDKTEAGLVDIKDAAQVYSAYCSAWRAGADAIPARVAQRISRESDPSAIQRLLVDEHAQLWYEMERCLTEYFAAQGEDFNIR